MSQTSNRGYYDRFSPEVFAEGRPVSAAYAWLLRNNLLHLRDQFTQVRINACASKSDYGQHAFMNNALFAPAGVSFWHQTFVHTWFDKQTPANLDYRIDLISTPTTGRDVDVTLRILPHFKSGVSGPFASGQPWGAGDSSAPVLHEDSVNLSSGTIVSMEGKIEFNTSDRHARARDAFHSANYPAGQGVNEEGEFGAKPVALMRLELVFQTNVENTGAGIARVLVREYA